MTTENPEIQDEMEEILEQDLPEVESNLEKEQEPTPEKEIEKPEEENKLEEEEEVKPKKKKTAADRVKEIKQATYELRQTKREIQAELSELRRLKSKGVEEQSEEDGEKNTKPQKSEEEIYNEVSQKRAIEQRDERYFKLREDALESDPQYFKKEKYVAQVAESYGNSAMANAILDSEKSISIVKHLYANDDEAERIAALSPNGAIKAIGSLEERLSRKVSKNPPASPNPPAKPKASGAPKSLEDLDYESYKRQQNKAQFGNIYSG